MNRNQSAILSPPGFDSTLAFLKEGYLFVGRRCDRLRSDHFRTRLMFSPVICMRGPAAAEQFYHEDRFTRRDALPPTTVAMLQDWGSVQMLDGGEHRHRKRMFMNLMDGESLRRATAIFQDEWGAAAANRTEQTVALHDALELILTRTALRWCGIPLDFAEPDRRRAEFASMIKGAGSFGPYYLRAKLLRARSENWAQEVIRAVREGRLLVERSSPVEQISLHRNSSGELLPEKDAAVELLNLLRPTVAVARFITFAAHALHVHQGRETLGDDPSDADVLAFVQEVRRFYPFFPLVGGRVREGFTWRGLRFSQGDWVLLDLYGTNHHPDAWPEAEAFRPERFRDWKGDAFTFVAQGGGGFVKSHRCAGEWLTIALVSEAVRCLLASAYTVPEQDLSIPMNRFPTLPRSGFIMRMEKQ